MALRDVAVTRVQGDVASLRNTASYQTGNTAS